MIVRLNLFVVQNPVVQDIENIRYIKCTGSLDLFRALCQTELTSSLYRKDIGESNLDFSMYFTLSNFSPSRKKGDLPTENHPGEVGMQYKNPITGVLIFFWK